MKTHKGKSRSRHSAGSNSSTIKLNTLRTAANNEIEFDDAKNVQNSSTNSQPQKNGKISRCTIVALESSISPECIQFQKFAESSLAKISSEEITARDILKANSSTPRRKKNRKFNLYTNLSPKYIGFSTPKSAPSLSRTTPVYEDSGRITRKKPLYHNIESISCNKSLSNDLFISSTGGCVRRTNSSTFGNSLSGSDSDTSQRRSFESPIEKLLRKNKTQTSNKSSSSPSAVFEQYTKPKKPIQRKELMDIKVKVERVESLEMLHKNGINTFQLDQHDNVINITATTNLEDCASNDSISKLGEDHLQCNDNLHQNSELSTEMQITNVDIVNLENLDVNTRSSGNSSIDCNPNESNDEIQYQEIDESNFSNYKNDIEEIEKEIDTKKFSEIKDSNVISSKESEENIENLDVIVEIHEPIIQEEGETDASPDILIIDNQMNETTAGCKITTASELQHNEAIDCQKLQIIQEEGEQTDIQIFDTQMNETTAGCNIETVSELQYNEATDCQKLHAYIPYTVTENFNNINEFLIPEVNTEEENAVEDENANVKNTANCSDCMIIEVENNNAIQHAATSQKFVYDAKIDEVEVEDVDINVKPQDHSIADNIISIQSPVSSTDSAKGSSVTNDVPWVTFSTGDIFWGRIYSYSYWPCIVCPDPEGKTITTEVTVGRREVPQVLVHVRFFADNARRNWVKRVNLLTYNGLEHYQLKLLEAEEKYGKKSQKYKAFSVSKSKQKLWNQAIEEANLVKSTPIEKRMEKFNEMYEHSRLVSKMQRKRRQSMYVTLDSTSDIGSLYASSDNLSLKQVPTGAKRDRSISPFSPAYSPIAAKSTKRRKLTEDEEPRSSFNNTMTYQRHFQEVDLQNRGSLNQLSVTSTPSHQDEEIFENNEFKTFFSAMKEFVMKQNNDEKLERSLIIAVRNIWALRHINDRQMEARATENVNEHDLGSSMLGGNYGSFKRLSNRLRILSLKRNATKQIVGEANIVEQMSLTLDTQSDEKEKKILNRPIEEVIDDIFNLDNKYLFKGLNRDPICKYCFKPGDTLEKCSKYCQTWFHVDCIGKSKKEKSKKAGRRPKTLTNIVTNELILDKNSTHVTANEIELHSLAHDDAKSTEQTQKRDGLVMEKSTYMLAIASELQGEGAVCLECSVDEEPKCSVCKRNHIDLGELAYCNIPHCVNAFHPSCCKYWPQSKITKSKNKIESFRCPSHVCHTCVSDDPKGKFQNISSSKLTKCVKCPATFHTDSTCIPAGSQILTAAYIICPRHSISKTDQKVNVNWCFICVGGGQVICCETCPTAVHAACLKIQIDSEESYICEECETGRMPLYGEMVWAKYNNFRWWPAIILPPTEIPQNILRMTHSPSDFVVRFFGTHDHGWISRRRVYLYLEGDSTEPPKYRTSLDNNYTSGVEEAKRIWDIIKSKKNLQRFSYGNKQKLHPQPYVKIKSNRAVPPLKLHIDLEKVSKCDCNSESENPCGPESNCLNRVLYHECNPKLCPAGERCQNQMFESRISPKLEVVYMKERGFGLVCREPISAGTFVIEYVGEVINDDEFKQRMTQKSIDRDENFYFLTLEKDYIIDAGPKGNLARFMNHSCEPNCETQKWSVNGLNRVGLFAITDILADKELTFNYHWDDLLGSGKKTCFCGSSKCTGLIGAKLKETKVKDDLKTIKNKKNKVSRKANTKPLKRLQKNAARTIAEKPHKIRAKSTLKKTKKPELGLLNDFICSSNEEPSVER